MTTFTHHGLLLLICFLGCSQLNTTSLQPGLARADVASPSVPSTLILAAKSRDLWGLLSTCSPPLANPCPQPCRATLSALPNPQEVSRTLLSSNPRCKLWHTPHFSISIFHCKEAGTAIFILFPCPLRCGGEEVHF